MIFLPMLETAWLYLHSSGQNTGTWPWRTDGQTDDGQAARVLQRSYAFDTLSV